MSGREFGGKGQSLDGSSFGGVKQSNSLARKEIERDCCFHCGDANKPEDVGWIERHCALEQTAGFREVVSREALVPAKPSLKTEVHRVGIRRMLRPPGLGGDERQSQGVRKARDNFVLHIE